MAIKSDTYPLHIVDRPTTHSYISEYDQTVVPYFEYYCNSAIGDYFKDMINCIPFDFLNDIKGIKLDYLNKIKNDFIGEKLQLKDYQLLSRICILISILNENNQIILTIER